MPMKKLLHIILLMLLYTLCYSKDIENAIDIPINQNTSTPDWNNNNEVILALNNNVHNENATIGNYKYQRNDNKGVGELRYPEWWYGQYSRPLFALKTNLLFDVATFLNIELEVPIGKKFSISGEYSHPWWIVDNGQADSKRHRLEVISGCVEAKYWIRKQDNANVLSGFYVGLNAYGGLYDFEYNKNGYQGEFISGGLSLGYAHSINNAGNLKLEYSLGLGYLQTEYSEYYAQYYGEDDWRAILEKKGKANWIGPTRAKVSLSWLLFSTKKRKVKTHKGTKGLPY